MKKFKVSGVYTEIIYAENEEDALEKFNDISADYASEEFDEYEIRELEPILPQNPMCMGVFCEE